MNPLFLPSYRPNAKGFHMECNAMFCAQCQEAAGGVACTKAGVCGKTPSMAHLQDVLLDAVAGLAAAAVAARGVGSAFDEQRVARLVNGGLFFTITNVNFDEDAVRARIDETLAVRDEIASTAQQAGASLPPIAQSDVKAQPAPYMLQPADEDIRSLRQLAAFGLKGMAAYLEHASVLGCDDAALHADLQNALAKSADDALGAGELVALVLEIGGMGVRALALLDEANTQAYGTPEITDVSLGVRNNPAILVSGHDLSDLEQLLEQTRGTGVDVYTHGEMLPAHAYPAFKKYDNLVGNYGGAWWSQRSDIESFGGPVLFTTNCIVPPLDSYKNRLYTTGAAGVAGCAHIEEGENGKKDFSAIINQAKSLSSPQPIEDGSVVAGFAHAQVLALVDKVIDAVKSGAIGKFVVMAGCDGRQKSREYYADFARALPSDAVILTAGCAKYRYNKLDLGDIAGIPRVLDAGQCNDSYSLAVIAMKLQEAFGLDDINDLPIVYNIAWYEQKAVIVLLALLSLGVKNIHLGPTLPAFLSSNVAKVLVENFGIAGISDVESDMGLFFN